MANANDKPPTETDKAKVFVLLEPKSLRIMQRMAKSWDWAALVDSECTHCLGQAPEKNTQRLPWPGTSEENIEKCEKQDNTQFCVYSLGTATSYRRPNLDGSLFRQANH